MPTLDHQNICFIKYLVESSADRSYINNMHGNTNHGGESMNANVATIINDTITEKLEDGTLYDWACEIHNRLLDQAEKYDREEGKAPEELERRLRNVGRWLNSYDETKVEQDLVYAIREAAGL